jgi:hypothetical protein
VIAQIIEKLELKEIGSISKMPRTSAACLNNIRRCLNFLKENKSKVDPNELYCEQGVLEGCPLAIISVIQQIYQAYSINIAKLDSQM